MHDSNMSYIKRDLEFRWVMSKENKVMTWLGKARMRQAHNKDRLGQDIHKQNIYEQITECYDKFPAMMIIE